MTENPNTRRTTVLGDPEQVDLLLQAGGRGALSEAFRIGCKIKLQLSSSDIEQLKLKREDLQNQKSMIDGELQMIEDRILELQEATELKIQAAEDETSKIEHIVDEFERCSSKIMFGGQTQLLSYLASISGIDAGTIRAFYSMFELEPSRETIEKFLQE